MPLAGLSQKFQKQQDDTSGELRKFSFTTLRSWPVITKLCEQGRLEGGTNACPRTTYLVETENFRSRRSQRVDVQTVQHARAGSCISIVSITLWGNTMCAEKDKEVEMPEGPQMPEIGKDQEGPKDPTLEQPPHEGNH